MIKPPTACKRCGRAAEQGTICKECRKSEPVTARGHAKYNREAYASHPTDKLYHQAKWTDRFRPAFLASNPVCQRMHGTMGQLRQCHRGATILHHLVDPKKDLSRFMDPTNVVAVCKDCHPGGQEGAKPDEHYSPTKWMGTIVRQEDPLTGNLIVSPETGINAWLNSLQKPS